MLHFIGFWPISYGHLHKAGPQVACVLQKLARVFSRLVDRGSRTSVPIAGLTLDAGMSDEQTVFTMALLAT
jgi:hypothetical protein